MNGVDLVLILTLMAFALRGYWRGFVREGFGVVALIAGVAAALQFTGVGVAVAQERLALPPAGQTGVVFAAIFVAVHAVVNLTGVVVDRLAGASRLWANHLAGALLGVAKGTIVLAIVLLFLHLLPIVPTAAVRIMGSAVARPLVAAASNVLRSGERDAPPESPRRT